MHKTDLAPVLSATSNRDSVWIILIYSQLAPDDCKNLRRSDQSWSRHARTTISTLKFGQKFPDINRKEVYYYTLLSGPSTICKLFM